MSLLDGIKRYFIVIFDHTARAEPIVIESLPPVLPSQRAGKGDCDITGRVLKSHYTMHCDYCLVGILLPSTD